ncbi:MAG: hypothetical protein ACOCZ4_00330 [Bacteroidota bacterium]
MALTRTGPVTRNAQTVALGLAKILVGKAMDNIADITQVLDETADSMGAMASTNFVSEVEYWKLESGFPMLEDLSLPLRESARLECEFKEISLRNLAIARGIDADEEGYPHALTAGVDEEDSINLGSIKAPDYVRMEAIYTYPDQQHRMIIVFPRANVTSSMELSLAAEDNVNVPVTFEAKRADSGVDGIDGTEWDEAPLGKIFFEAVTSGS